MPIPTSFVKVSGNDIHEVAAMDPKSVEVLMAKVRRAFWKLAEFPVPVIAQVNGADEQTSERVNDGFQLSDLPERMKLALSRRRANRPLNR